MSFSVRLANLEDINRIKLLADKHRKELGFIIRSALVESVNHNRLLIEDYSGAFCHFRKRKDNVTVIYEICVPMQFRNMGIGKLFISNLKNPIQLKCPVDNESNLFYNKLGFVLIGKETGKKRELNVWRLG